MSLPAGLKAEIHDLADIEHAIHELGQADRNRLLAAAFALIRGFHVNPAPHDHKDLLSDAVTRTLAGERGWRRGVDFVHHLIQVMRSVASDWRRRSASRAAQGHRLKREADLLSPMVASDDDRASRHPRAGEGNKEASWVAAAEVEELKRHFAGDPEVTQVIACLELDMIGRQMQEHTGMSRRQLATAMQRLRRGARRWRDSHGR